MSSYNYFAYYEQINSIEYVEKFNFFDVKNEKKDLKNLEITNYLNDNMKYPIQLPFDSGIKIELNESINSINKKYNDFLVENQGFDYLHWRRKNYFHEISFTPQEIHKVNTLLDKEFNYNIELFISEIECYLSKILRKELDLKSLSDRVIFVDSDNSKCIEFPVSKKSYIIFGKDAPSYQSIIYLIHEIGHYLFNEFKYKYKILTAIEEDEYFAHMFEIAIVKTVFTTNEKIIYKNFLSQILNTNLLLTEFQYKLFKEPLNFDMIQEKEIIFNKLKSKYNIISNSSNIQWYNHIELFSTPFYSGSYVNPQINALSFFEGIDFEQIFIDLIQKFKVVVH